MPHRWITTPPLRRDACSHWLTQSGSLTARIIARCDAFRVERRFQGLRVPGRDEAARIGLARGRLAHVREVVLYADGRPVVFAHSILAPDDLRGAWRSVGRLGNRPLAAALFANPRVLRSPLEFRRIDQRHTLHAHMVEAGLEPPPALWARRSLFRLQNRPLLVTEVFLPAIATLE